MKNVIIYSSKTGNTKKIAEALRNAYDIECVDLNDLENLDKYNDYRLILGFWIDKGYANESMLEVMKSLRNREVAFFFTQGSYTNIPYAQEIIKNNKKILEDGNNNVVLTFSCQGKIDSKLEEKYKNSTDPHHRMDEARIKLHQDAAKHPDEEDIANAIKTFEVLFK